MITQFIKGLIKRQPKPKKVGTKQIAAQRISKKTHRIDPHLLSKNAVKVTQVLQQAGYSAFIVGGAVRD